ARVAFEHRGVVQVLGHVDVGRQQVDVRGRGLVHVEHVVGRTAAGVLARLARLKGPRSAALTYIGSGYSALPAFATSWMERAMCQAWKVSSASAPNTSRHVPGRLPSRSSRACGTWPSNACRASGE